MPNMSSQPSITAESQIHQRLSPELIQRCAEDFKNEYRTSLRQILADPLDLDTLVQFEHIYTNLDLKEKHGEDKHILEYSDLFNLHYNGKFPRRLLVQGEAGAGKTTLCAQIAWDWINGKYFQDFKWVIIVPLRKHNQRTIGEMAKSFLPENNPATATQLTEYMRSNTDKVFIVFDGLDEFAGNLTLPKEEGSKSTELQSQSPYPTTSSKCQAKEGNSNSPTKNESTSMSDKDIEIGEILRSEKLKECPVMVTTRPWRAEDITRNDQLQKMYRFIYVEGFSKENISAYIHRYFCDDEAKANDLIQCVGDNDILSENMRMRMVRSKECFPQISKGNLEMNSHQQEMDSLLHSLTCPNYQGSLLSGKTSHTSDIELTSDDELTSKIPTPDLTWTRGYVDGRGKDLLIPSYGFILSIPPGALEEGSHELITCEALPSLPDNLKLNFDDLIVSPGFQCFPPGLKFKKPVKLIIPHCAVFNYPSRVRTVLISTDRQHSGKVLRTPLPRDACAVNHSHFELLLRHFPWACVIQVANASALKGKRMLCMPFLPKIMPDTRKPYLELRLRDKPHDPALKEARTDDISQPVKDEEDEIFVRYKDLEVRCQFDEDDPGKPQSNKISESNLFTNTKHQEYFKLDLNGKSNETPVKVQFLQAKKSFKEIMFYTRFAGVATSSVDAKERSQPSSCSSNRPYTRSRKRKADSACTQSHNIPGPPWKQVQPSRTTPGGASIAAGTKGKSKPPREVDELEYLELLTRIGPNGFYRIGNHLGADYQQCEAVLAKRLQNYPNALMELFMSWNIEQQEHIDIREVLAVKLEKSKLGMLADELRTECLV